MIAFVRIAGASGDHAGGHGSADAIGRAGNPEKVTRTITVDTPATIAAKEGENGVQPSPASPEMTDGVIRKVDRTNSKITIKHGEIKNLDMPGMTMVFQVQQPELLDQVQAGDKVKFRAEKVGSAFVITDLEPE